MLISVSISSPLPLHLYRFHLARLQVAILIGALAERGRIAPVVLFSFVWTTLVYCPLAYWVWAPGGWAFKWGVLDFSGGGPVEIGSGVGGFAYALVLGRRKESQLVNFRCARIYSRLKIPFSLYHMPILCLFVSLLTWLP